MEEKTTQMVFDHCVTVFERMRELAKEEELTDPSDASRTTMGLVYTGHMTKLILSELGLPGPYYTSTLKHLKAMDCILQLRRGGGNAESKWLILAKPTEDAFNSIVEMNRPRHGRMNRLEQELREVSRRVHALERKVGV